MAEHLQPTERHLPEQVADMQRICRGIETDVGRQRLGDRSGGKLFAIGGVVDQTASGKLGNDVTRRGHAEMLGERTTQLVDPQAESLQLRGHRHWTTATG